MLTTATLVKYCSGWDLLRNKLGGGPLPSPLQTSSRGMGQRSLVGRDQIQGVAGQSCQVANGAIVGPDSEDLGLLFPALGRQPPPRVLAHHLVLFT